MRPIDGDLLEQKLIKRGEGYSNKCHPRKADDMFLMAAYVKEQPTVDECEIHCGVHDELQRQLHIAQERNKEYIETIQALKANKSENLTGWIPYDRDELPTEDRFVLYNRIDAYISIWNIANIRVRDDIIAWQPLPKPYEESE